MKVTFENVGRHKMTWTADLPSLSWRSLEREVRAKRGALKSRSVDFEFNADGTAGVIYVGDFRPVGTFRALNGYAVQLKGVTLRRSPTSSASGARFDLSARLLLTEGHLFRHSRVRVARARARNACRPRPRER